MANNIQVHPYFNHFKGNFKGEQFDLFSQPKQVFHKHISCVPFAMFISNTILQRRATGAISGWGKVGELDPPHLLTPLTIEPSKCRIYE